jgi:serine/threonine-protein kinase
MASGQPPFKGKTGVDTLSQIIRDEPQPLTELAKNVPAEVERVVRKAMEKEAERRYQYADELATDLRNLQRDL